MMMLVGPQTLWNFFWSARRIERAEENGALVVVDGLSGVAP